MTDEPVPSADHISRYCGGATVLNGRPTAASFYLKDGEEYLSVNWLELLQLGGRDDEIAEIRRVLSTKLILGSTAKIAVLNVGEMKDHVRQNSPDQRDPRVLHRPDEPPDKPDPSHSGIFDTRLEEPLIAEFIAEKVDEIYTARA